MWRLDTQNSMKKIQRNEWCHCEIHCTAFSEREQKSSGQTSGTSASSANQTCKPELIAKKKVLLLKTCNDALLILLDYGPVYSWAAHIPVFSRLDYIFLKQLKILWRFYSCNIHSPSVCQLFLSVQHTAQKFKKRCHVWISANGYSITVARTYIRIHR